MPAGQDRRFSGRVARDPSPTRMKETVLSILRHALTAGGAALVAKGYVSDAGLTQIVGAVVALVGAVWGPLDEYIAARKARASTTNPNPPKS